MVKLVILEIRKLISKMTSLTRCLKDYGWTLDYGNYEEGQWSKTFTLPHPLLIKQHRRFYFQQKMAIQFDFSDYNIGLWVDLYSGWESPLYLHSYFNINKSALNWEKSLILQRIAVELPKIINSLKTESFYNETEQEQIEVIPVSELRAKISQLFEEVCKTFGAKPL